MFTSRYWVEPKSPVSVGSIRYGREVELWSVPATDPVVGAKVPRVGPEAVGCCPVPLGVDEHVVTLLVAQPGDGSLHGQVPLLQVELKDLIKEM